MSLRPLFRRWRAFWQSIPARAYGSYLPEPNDGITRLHSTAPTVTAEQVADFQKLPRTNPIDFKKLGVLE